MIEVDGSIGEGGGQILRTSLGLSCLLAKPFRIFNIRKGRKNPGLMPQHLTCVRAAQLISSAAVEGDFTGSRELSFAPHKVKGGEFLLDVGTAGSTMLVLQTIMPALLFSDERSAVTLKGGTHVPFSPSFHYVQGVLLPVLEEIGVRMSLSIDQYGFYPKGGGRIRAELFPLPALKALNLRERGRAKVLKALSCVGNLPMSIAERQRSSLLEALNGLIDPGCAVEIEVSSVPTPGQGTFLFLRSESEGSIAGFTALGERGKSAETVGREAAAGYAEYAATGAALDPHLADQIVLYLSMCKEHSLFTTSRITGHLITNLRAIGLFTEFTYSLEGEIGNPGTISIRGVAPPAPGGAYRFTS